MARKVSFYKIMASQEFSIFPKSKGELPTPKHKVQLSITKAARFPVVAVS